MPQKLSSFIGSSKIATSNITLNLNNYGTIDTNETHTAAVNNAAVFKKAYEDYLNYRFSYNDAVNCYIDCPPGDYYFGDNPNNDFEFYPITLDPPQGSTITIRSTVELDWDNRPSTSSLENAPTPEDRYDIMKDYYKTRFHFARNGILGKTSVSEGTKPNIQNIGLFGRYDGSPGKFNKATDIWGRGISGGLSVNKCGVQGFGAVDGTLSDIKGTLAEQGWGVSARYGDRSYILNIQIIDCIIGITALYNGTIFFFGDVDLIHNMRGGAVAFFGGSIQLGGDNIYGGSPQLGGKGRAYISEFDDIGVNAYAGGIIHFGWTSNTSDIHTVSGGRISIRAAEKGLISAHRNQLSYSNDQTSNDGLIFFYT